MGDRLPSSADIDKKLGAHPERAGEQFDAARSRDSFETKSRDSAATTPGLDEDEKGRDSDTDKAKSAGGGQSETAPVGNDDNNKPRSRDEQLALVNKWISGAGSSEFDPNAATIESPTGMEE